MNLYALTARGPQRLAVPGDVSDPTRVFDGLPLGIYEALRTFRHVRFVGLEEHLARARASAERARLGLELDEGALRAALQQVVEEAPGEDSRVRFDLLSGPADALGSPERVLIQTVPLKLPPAEAYRDGVRVPTTARVRRTDPEVKAARWVIERRAAYPGPGEGHDPILVDEQGRLLEGVMSNLFLVRGGELWTAPTEGVLAGVTRGFVLRIARELGLGAREAYVARAELSSVDEAFFSTSVRGILPVVAIDAVELGTGRPGPVTTRLMRAYSDFCAREARPALS